MPRIKVNRWQLFAKLVPFYLLFMGAVVALMGVVSVWARSWSMGFAAVVALSAACFVAHRTGERLSTSPD